MADGVDVLPATGTGKLRVATEELNTLNGVALSPAHHLQRILLAVRVSDGVAVDLRASDYDTGAGSDYLPLLGLGLPKSGGAVAGGTSTDPFRVDPTGTTTQPVSAVSLPLPSGAATQATLASVLSALQGSLAVSAASLPLPSGAATETTLSGASAKLPATLGQKAMATSLAVAIASNQSTLAVSLATALRYDVDSITAVVVGDVPDGAVDTASGVVKVGGVYPGTAPPIYLEGSRAPLTIGARGAVRTEIWQHDGDIAVGVAAAGATIPATSPALAVLGLNYVYDSVGGQYQRQLMAANAIDLPGTGIGTSALVAQLDDVATSTVTENQFGTVRMSTRRALLVEGVSGGTAFPVTGTFWQATQPVSAASLPLPSGAATETTLAAQSAKLPATLGQKLMASSLAVVIASDQSAVPISAASLPLPTGAATATLQGAGLPAALGAGGGLKAEGNVPAGGADSGNGVKAAGVFNTTTPTLTNGWRGDLQLGLRGSARVELMAPGSASSIAAVTTGEAVSVAGTGLVTVAMQYAYNGATVDKVRMPNVFKTFSALGSGAEVTAWTPGSGKKPRVMRLFLACSVAGDVLVRDNTAGTTILTIPVLAGDPVAIDLGNGILAAVANNVITLDAPGAGTLSGFLCGTEE